VQNSYLTHIKDYNIRQAWPTPEKAALLVIDMQLYFKPIAQPIVDNVISLIECFGKNDGRILFTRHGHRDPKTDGGMLGKWWGDLILCGSAEWELIDELHIASLKNLAYGFAHIVNTKDLRQILEIT